jgi:hypothetical protein
MFNTKSELDAASDQFLAYYAQQAASGRGRSWSKQGALRSPLSEVQEGQEELDVVRGARDQQRGQQQQQAGMHKGREVELRDVEAGRFTPDQVERFYDAVEQVESGQRRQQAAAAAGRSSRREKGPEMASWFGQLRVLFWRELLAITRNPADVAGRMLIFTWISIFLGLIYFDLGNNIADLRSRMNVLFIQPVIFLLLPYVYMSLYTSDKQYFIADVSAKLYSPSAYYVAKQLAILPFAILNVLVFSYTLYGMAGLRYDAMAMVGNGLLSVLLYLIAAQVRLGVGGEEGKRKGHTSRGLADLPKHVTLGHQLHAGHTLDLLSDRGLPENNTATGRIFFACVIVSLCPSMHFHYVSIFYSSELL